MGYELVIENARIVDGASNPWFRGSIGIEQGTIKEVSNNPTGTIRGETILNVGQAVVSPGFIDAHSHSDLRLFSDPSLCPKVRQGITTEILGQDGFSMAPIYGEDKASEWQEHLSGLAGRVDENWTWGSMSDYLDAVDEAGVGLNVATLVGHGTVRYQVMGMEDREADSDELDQMAELVTEALEEGAIGFSTGLVYSPQLNATTEEVQRLAGRLHSYGRPFVAHIRSEGKWIWDALDEFIDIGDEEDIPVHLSHYKVAGSMRLGRAERANHVLEVARERGVDVTVDQYPYTVGSTMLSALLPPWLHDDGTNKLLERIEDPDVRERAGRDIEEWRIDGWENVAGLFGWDNIVITNVKTSKNADMEGATVEEIAIESDSAPIDVVCDLLIKEDMEVSIEIHGMSEDDIQKIMANEHVAISTDGIFGKNPHPRTYGTYPRVLAKYVRELNLFSLEEAIRKMTSLPARAMGLTRKGLIRPEMDADLVVFDPDSVRDRSTFEDSTRYPTGIHHVLVNGEFAVRDGKPTEISSGQVLRA